MPETKLRRRRLTPLERRLREKYTRLVKFKDIFGRNTYGAEFIVWDKIGQGFRVADDTTKNRAEWYRDVLAVALARTVEAEREA